MHSASESVVRERERCYFIVQSKPFHDEKKCARRDAMIFKKAPVLRVVSMVPDTRGLCDTNNE